MSKPVRYRAITPIAVRPDTVTKRKRSNTPTTTLQDILRRANSNSKALTSAEYMKFLLKQRDALKNCFKDNKPAETERVRRGTLLAGKPPTGRPAIQNPDNSVKESENKPIAQLPPRVPPPRTVKVNTYNKQTFDVYETKSLLDQQGKTLYEDYTVGRQIGQGAYATVRFAIHNPSSTKIALKTYENVKLLDIQRKKSVNREIYILEKLDHPGIVKLIDKIHTPKELHLAMEYIEGTSLHGHLKRRANRRLDEREAKHIFLQVLDGIAFCHSNNVTHRDIKLENILIGHRRNVKLIDFGFSTCFPHDRKIRLFCGTPSYMAPEIVARKEYSGPPADMWALGVLLYVLLCGQFPFKGASDRELYRKIQIGQFIVPQHVPTGAKLLINKMLRVDPRNRISASLALKDEWLNSSQILESTGPLADEVSQLKGISMNGDLLDLNIVCSIVSVI